MTIEDLDTIKLLLEKISDNQEHMIELQAICNEFLPYIFWFLFIIIAFFVIIYLAKFVGMLFSGI